MSPLVSRIAVTAVLLPIVLGVVWLGGWWLFGLALVGGLVALHELYAIARGLRPIVLGGYAGSSLVLLGAQLGGPTWVLAGILRLSRGAARLLRLERPPERGRSIRGDPPRGRMGRGGLAA